MFPRAGGFKDPDQLEIRVFVAIAAAGLLLFYAAGSYVFYRKEKPVYEGMAAAAFDPGTGRVRFVWFPPKPIAEGKVDGRPVHFAINVNGRQVERQVLVEYPARNDFKATHRDWRDTVPAFLQPVIAPVLQLPDFQRLTVQSKSGLTWQHLTNRPMVFGQQAGVYLVRADPNITAEKIRTDAQLLIRLGDAGL